MDGIRIITSISSPTFLKITFIQVFTPSPPHIHTQSYSKCPFFVRICLKINCTEIITFSSMFITSFHTDTRKFVHCKKQTLHYSYLSLNWGYRSERELHSTTFLQSADVAPHGDCFTRYRHVYGRLATRRRIERSGETEEFFFFFYNRRTLRA
jgi:hypothetical protein